MIIGNKKISTRAIIINGVIVVGAVIEYVTPRITDYQSIIPQHAYAVIASILPIATIIWHQFQPLIISLQADEDTQSGDSTDGTK